MNRIKTLVAAWPLILLGSCVTINVYFPAAAAEKAADRIIEEVWGEDAQPAKETPVPDKQSGIDGGQKHSIISVSFRARRSEDPESRFSNHGALDSRLRGNDKIPSNQAFLNSPEGVGFRLFNLLVPSAHAQAPDLDITSPAIAKIKGAMKSRHGKLSRFYDLGAAGLSNNGLIGTRDPRKVPLKDRRTLAQLVAAENKDRAALYREIARANGHPEWEADIRRTFARRWVSRARGGWWYQDSSGNWRQK